MPTISMFYGILVSIFYGTTITTIRLTSMRGIREAKRPWQSTTEGFLPESCRLRNSGCFGCGWTSTRTN